MLISAWLRNMLCLSSFALRVTSPAIVQRPGPSANGSCVPSLPVLLPPLSPAALLAANVLARVQDAFTWNLSVASDRGLSMTSGNHLREGLASGRAGSSYTNDICRTYCFFLSMAPCSHVLVSVLVNFTSSWQRWHQRKRTLSSKTLWPVLMPVV